MKHLFSLLTLLVITVVATAQDSIPVPDNFNSVYLVSEGGILPLEKQTLKGEAKANAGHYIAGLGKIKKRLVVKQEKSPVRIKGGSKVCFIVKRSNYQLDPIEGINIFQLEADPGKDRRTIEIYNARSYGGARGANTKKVTFIPFEYRAYKTDCLVFEIPAQPAGEYAITVEGARDYFQLFGVDAQQ